MEKTFVKGNIKIVFDYESLWMHMYNLKVKEPKPNFYTHGKYLFFARDDKKLIELAMNLLQKYGLYHAKTTRGNYSDDWVLCVYDTSPKLKEEMKQYADEKTIKYRWWKYDVDSIDGKYSKFVKTKS